MTLQVAAGAQAASEGLQFCIEMVHQLANNFLATLQLSASTS